MITLVSCRVFYFGFFGCLPSMGRHRCIDLVVSANVFPEYTGTQILY